MVFRLFAWLIISLLTCLFLGLDPPEVWSTSDCDKALHFLGKGRYSATPSGSLSYFKKAIELCPGFIRPYELAGNIYMKQGKPEIAIDFLSQAAELGSTNYKLYYLLAELLFQKGEIDEAGRYVEKSLRLQGDYTKSLELKHKIDTVLDQEGPRIKLYEPSTPSGMILVHMYKNITVRGVAIDKSGLDWVRVNDLHASLDPQGNFLKDIPLQIGRNQVIIEASDRLGNRSRTKVVVKRKQSGLGRTADDGPWNPALKVYSKSFAVVIGINQYEKWPALEFALNDALAIKKRLQAEGFDEVTTIVNRDATQRRILTELFHTLPQKVGQNDRVFFYFAGHGQTQELAGGGRKGYIIPVDSDPMDYTTTAISMEQIRSLSKHIRAKHILYVMDCCYSGLGLSRGLSHSYKTKSNLSGYVKKMASMRAVQIITAGGKGEQVQEKAGHGLFTTYFLKGLNGEADVDSDSVVTATELGAFLRPKVSEASQQKQTPLYGRLEGEGEVMFFVADH